MIGGEEEYEALRSSLLALRAKLEPAFCAETAVAGSWAESKPRATGHCAVVAAIVHEELGGSFVSQKVEGSSHWYNRFKLADGRVIDVDLTGDQFGRWPIQISAAGGTLYGESPKERVWPELNADTLARKELLRSKAGLEPSCEHTCAVCGAKTRSRRATKGMPLNRIACCESHTGRFVVVRETTHANEKTRRDANMVEWRPAGAL